MGEVVNLRLRGEERCSLCILNFAFEDKTVVIATESRPNISLMPSGLSLILICSWPFYSNYIVFFTKSDPRILAYYFSYSYFEQ